MDEKLLALFQVSPTLVQPRLIQFCEWAWMGVEGKERVQPSEAKQDNFKSYLSAQDAGPLGHLLRKPHGLFKKVRKEWGAEWE